MALQLGAGAQRGAAHCDDDVTGSQSSTVGGTPGDDLRHAKALASTVRGQRWRQRPWLPAIPSQARRTRPEVIKALMMRSVVSLIGTARPTPCRQPQC